MPAHKKDSSTRRRRNVASTATKLRAVDPDERAELADDVPPLLPALRPDPRDPETKLGWLAITRKWWAELWVSPMSGEYHESDVFQLYVLADLYDRYWRHPSTALAAEIRQQRALFGMTPYDRRRLEWTIEEAEQAKDRGTRRRRDQEGRDKSTSGAPAVDPRQIMGAL